MQPDVEWLLGQHSTKAADICVQLHERIHLGRNGQTFRRRAPQVKTAWDTLYSALRRPLQDSRYRQDSELVELRQNGEHVQVRFADDYETSRDFLIAGDGVNSDCRTVLVGNVAAEYAGYVAWRGLEKERDLPVELVQGLADRFTLFHTNGMQMLCYLVPGIDGGTSEGRRRVNWVWYINTPEQSLPAVLRGESRRSYRSFVPAGDVGRDAEAQVHELAATHLPTAFRELVSRSRLFLQPVHDVAAQPRLQGRCALIGDAAGTVRRHTASGTSKAFADATLLAMALGGWSAGHPFPEDRLQCWERQRQGDLAMMSHMGMRLAASSGLGVKGAGQPWRTG